MLFLVGNVGEPIGYVFCVFPLVEFCLRPDFRVYVFRGVGAILTASLGFLGIKNFLFYRLPKASAQLFFD